MTAKKRRKIPKIAEKYGLDNMDEFLTKHWTAEDSERKSLRELADMFNKRVFSAALSDTTLTSGEIKQIYSILEDNDAPQTERVRIRRKVAKEGIDIEEIRADFVTHQTIYTYLTDVVDVDSPERETTIESKVQTIEKLAGKTVVVGKKSLSELSNVNKLNDRNYRVVVDVTVICENCQSSYQFEELVTNGGCNCAVEQTADTPQ